MEIPGVEKKDVEVNIENDVLRVKGPIDFAKYEGLDPLYTEYNVGSFRPHVYAIEQDRPAADRRPAR